MSNIALVTGGAGFLGSHLVDHLLNNDFHVRVIDNMSTGSMNNLIHWKNSSKLEILEKDILELEANEAFFKDVKYVFHLASADDYADSLFNPAHYTTINFLGTIKVLECCRYQKIQKVIYTSSYQIYGTPNIPTLETDPPRPLTPYALSKISAERAIEQWSFNFGLPINILRLTEAYGPRCHYPHGQLSSFIDVWMGQKAHGIPLSIVGSMDDKRDLIYCTDVANACLSLAEHGENRLTYNIGSGKTVSLGEIAGKISEKFNLQGTLTNFPKEIWLDTSRSSFKTVWSPRIDFEKGIEFTLATMDEWKSRKPWQQEEIAEIIEKWNSCFKTSV